MLTTRAFTEEEKKERSTRRELTVFRDTLTNPTVLAMFAGRTIVHYTDNQAMVHVIARGSRRNPENTHFFSVVKLNRTNSRPSIIKHLKDAHVTSNLKNLNISPIKAHYAGKV